MGEYIFIKILSFCSNNYCLKCRYNEGKKKETKKINWEHDQVIGFS